jgi:hypothetical protein
MQNFFVAASETFKPLFFGFENPFAALLRSSSSASKSQERADTLQGLELMAQDVESMQPSFAAELRSFAARG